MRRWLVGLVGFVLTVGCGAAKHYEIAPAAAQVPTPAPVLRLAEAERGPAVQNGLLAGQNGGEAQPTPRKIIYTGQYVVDVYDLKAAQKAIIGFTESVGGHLQQMRGNTVVLRVPAEQFTAVEPKLRELGRVDDSQTDVQAQDVTEQYYDVKLRLESKKKYLANLYELLNTAGKLKDKLAVQKEIARVVEDIEALEGRLRLLANKVTLATVTVTFRLATQGPKRTFKLPWDWLDELGVEWLVM